MNKIILTALAIVSTATLLADEAKTPAQTKKGDVAARTGGFVVKSGTGKGSITIVNCQKKVGRSDIVAATESIRKDARFRFDIRELDKPLAMPSDGRCLASVLKDEAKAQVLILVIDDPKKPNVVSAPEDGWAVVNVANLESGLATDGAKKKFVPARMRREILRAFSFAAGAGGSQFPGNVLSVNSLKELDYCGEFIPMDAVQRIVLNLKDKGLEPEHGTTYRRACMEGWAPAPTNDVQKAIWERVNSKTK